MLHDVLPPTVCVAAPTVAGLRYYPHNRVAWLAFACDQHADELIAPRALLPRDCAVLARRRAHRDTELVGQRWTGEREAPLARGPAAERLIERARAWAALARDPNASGDSSPLTSDESQERHQGGP